MSDPNRIYVPDTKHSDLGPSGADRWMNCKGSNNLIKKIGRRPASSREAEEGSAAHAVAARCLMTGESAWQSAGKIVCIGKNEYVVDEEMVEGVQVFVDEVNRLRAEYPNGILYVERELSSVLDEEAFGAGDVIYEVPSVAIFVLDLKYGKGVVVDPKKPQTRIYGYMAYEGRSERMQGSGEPSKIICGIVQPRIPHPDGLIRYAPTYDVADTEEWFATVVLPAMQDTRDPEALLQVGEWCQFCDANRANKCPAIFKKLETFDVGIEPITLNGEQIGEAITLLDILLKKQEHLKTEALQRALTGESIKGFKIVRQKTNRVLKDSMEQDVLDGTGQPTFNDDGSPKRVTIQRDDAVNFQFGLEAYEPAALKSPAQLEKLPMGKEFVAQWSFKPTGNLTLAPLSDNRVAVKPLMQKADELYQQAATDRTAVGGIPV